jgi:hypothetical protein
MSTQFDEISGPTVGAALEVQAGQWPRWPRRVLYGYLCFLFFSVALAMYLNMAADARGLPGLAFLAPLIDLLTSHVLQLREYYMPPRFILPACGVLLVLFGLFASVRWLRPREPAAPLQWERWFVFAEVSCLILITLTTVVFRFYALNHIPNDFIGELVFMIVATSDLPTLIAASGGSASNAPWAPLGLLYFLLMGGMWRISGATVLTMCFATAVSSVALGQVLYWFVRLLGGPLAAIIAISLYTVSPIEMVWGRHSMQPFSYPSIPVLLLCATTYLAITRFHVGYWIATAFLMGVAHHSFGSGYSAFLIPLGAYAWLLLFDRPRFSACGWKAPLLLLVGVGLWIVGPSAAFSAGAGGWHWFSPFDPRLSSRAFRGAGWEGSIEGLTVNTTYLLNRLFIGSGDDVHQTPIGIFGRYPGTYIPPLATTLAMVGLVWLLFNRRRAMTAVLLPSVVATLIPGLISYANAHREAAFFPVLCAVGACAAAAGLRRFQARFHWLGAVAMVGLPLLVLPPMFARAGALYFSRPSGEPPSVTVTKSIKEQVAPGTVLLLDLPYALAIDAAYLLFDDSLVEPFAWDVLEEKDWPRAVDDPMPTYQHLFYRHSALKNRVTELQQTKWTRAVFIIHHLNDPERKVALLKAKYPVVSVQQVDPPTWRPPGTDAFTVVSVPLG